MDAQKPADRFCTQYGLYGYLLVANGFHSGNKKEMRDGVAWIRRGAKGGSVSGMNTLGTLLLVGNMGVARDKADGEHWLLKAAKLGNADSQQTLGELYAFGAGASGKPDVKAGLHWLHAAAMQGNAEAAGVLAYFLITGRNGAPKDTAEGVQWARKAIANSGAAGYYALGLAYQYGEGEPMSPASAWYDFAAAKRVDSKHELEHLDEHLSEVATKLSAAHLRKLQTEVSAIKVPTKNGSDSATVDN